jgi:hypothetical protein
MSDALDSRGETCARAGKLAAVDSGARGEPIEGPNTLLIGLSNGAGGWRERAESKGGLAETLAGLKPLSSEYTSLAQRALHNRHPRIRCAKPSVAVITKPRRSHDRLPCR